MRGFLLVIAAWLFASASFAQVGLAFPGPGTVHTTSGGAWTPTSEGANLVGWWKASGVTTSGSSVTRWVDSSGNSNDLAPSATNQTYSATSFNGHPGVTNPESTNCNAISNLTTAAITFSSSVISVVMIMQPDFTNPNDPSFFIYGGLIGNGQTHWYDNGKSINFSGSYGSPNTITMDSNSNTSVAQTITAGTPIVIGGQADGTNFKTFIDGTFSSSGSMGGTGPFGNPNFPVGNFNLLGAGGGYCAAGIIAEMMLFSSNPTPANIYSYAQTTYGIP